MISSIIPHADNIGPCLLGGLVLIKSIKPVDLIKIPIGPLYVSVIHPDIKISTKMAREILPKSIKMEDAVKQWSNIAGLTYGFTVNDLPKGCTLSYRKPIDLKLSYLYPELGLSDDEYLQWIQNKKDWVKEKGYEYVESIWWKINHYACTLV